MDRIYPPRKNRPIPVVALTSDPVGDGMTGRIGSTSKVVRSPRLITCSKELISALRATQRVGDQTGHPVGAPGAREGMVGAPLKQPARDTANYVKHAEQRARLPTPRLWLLPGA